MFLNLESKYSESLPLSILLMLEFQWSTALPGFQLYPGLEGWPWPSMQSGLQKASMVGSQRRSQGFLIWKLDRCLCKWEGRDQNTSGLEVCLYVCSVQRPHTNEIIYLRSMLLANLFCKLTVCSGVPTCIRTEVHNFSSTHPTNFSSNL